MAATPSACRLSELASTLDIPKSAAHRLLTEMQALGWVEQLSGVGAYRLTLRFALLGHRVLGAHGFLDLAQPVLQALADQSRELVRFTIASETGLAWLATAQGAPAGLMFQPSMDEPVRLFATANGKVFLASFDDVVALRLAQHNGLGTIRPTDRTHVTGDALLADLHQVRARGHATAKEEAELGVTAIAVAVRAAGGPVFGTLSVAGPTIRIDAREQEIAIMLHSTAATLSTLWPAHPVGPV